MSIVPEFSLAVPPRCHEPIGASPAANCGQIAQWMRSGHGVFDVGYFCDQHRKTDDIALPVSYVFRRLHLDAHIWIATASKMTGAAQLEAVARLEHCLNQAGAVMDVQWVHSTYGRYTRTPSPGNGLKVLNGGK